MQQLAHNARGTWPWTVACRRGRWVLAILLWPLIGVAGHAAVSVAPAAAGEELSRDYTVAVEGKQVPVYAVKVAPADPARRWKAMDDKVRSAEFFDKAAFATFDMTGPVKVTVTCPLPITTAKILPTSFQIVPLIEGKRLTLTLDRPRPVTVEVNGNWVGALHLFANPPETAAPRPDDPNVIYFGPGVHRIDQPQGRRRQDGLPGARGRGQRNRGGARPGDLAGGQEHRAPRPGDSRRGTLPDAFPASLARPRQGHHGRGHHPAGFEHLDHPHPPVRARDGAEREAAGLPGELRRHRRLQQP